jgi:hypothetical protein
MMTDITGRDSLIITEALATALVALEQLPSDYQPWSDMEDMRRLLAERSSRTVAVHLCEARCRLFPGLDPIAVRREYGLD